MPFQISVPPLFSHHCLRRLLLSDCFRQDLTPKEEVQLSLEQAFYLVADLKRLEVYLPAPPPLVQEAEEQQQQQQQVEPREDAMEQGNGEAGQEQEQEQQQKQEGVAAAGTKEDAEPKALSMVECWKAYVHIRYLLSYPSASPILETLPVIFPSFSSPHSSLSNSVF